MIWKGSYKFSFIFFKNNFVAFVSAFLYFDGLVCFEIWFLAWFSFDTKKEAGRKRELRNKFGGFLEKKKIWIAFGFWNLIRKYKNNPGCCLFIAWLFFFQSQLLSVFCFLNEKFLQFFLFVLHLLFQFHFSIQVTQRNCRARPDRQRNSCDLTSFWSR